MIDRHFINLDISYVDKACHNFIVLDTISTLPSACSVTNAPLTELPYLGGTYMNIYNDMVFNCHGKLFQWQFFARRNGTLFLDVWRLLANNMMRLIGKNRVIVNVNNDTMVTYVNNYFIMVIY